MDGMEIIARKKVSAMKKTYVIAGKYNEFVEWCQEKKVSPHSPLVEYVSEGTGGRTLRGLQQPEIIVCGTYRDRKDFQELEEIVRHVSRPPEPEVRIVYVEKETPEPIFNPFQSFRKVALEV